jgi:hypothetical protein
MNFAVKISLLASGLFLLAGMLTGVLKYRAMMRSETHNAPVYIDIAHRTALLYSFAMLVAAKLLEYNPYSEATQTAAAGLMMTFFALTFGGHLVHGLKNDTDNLFRERNFSTTWFMYLLIPAHIGGLSIILWGFISTQFLGIKY